MTAAGEAEFSFTKKVYFISKDFYEFSDFWTAWKI